VAGFLLELVAGFVGIRNLRTASGGSSEFRVRTLPHF
jgi:hypothetical protein